MNFSSPKFPSDAVFFPLPLVKMCLRWASALIVVSFTYTLLEHDGPCFRCSTLCSLIQPHLNLQKTSRPSLVERHLPNSFRTTKAKKMKLRKYSQWRTHRLLASDQRVRYKLYRCTPLRAQLSSFSAYIHHIAMR